MLVAETGRVMDHRTVDATGKAYTDR